MTEKKWYVTEKGLPCGRVECGMGEREREGERDRDVERWGWCGRGGGVEREKGWG